MFLGISINDKALRGFSPLKILLQRNWHFKTNGLLPSLPALGVGEAGITQAADQCQGDDESCRAAVHPGLHLLPPHGDQHVPQGHGPHRPRHWTDARPKLGRSGVVQQILSVCARARAHMMCDIDQCQIHCSMCVCIFYNTLCKMLLILIGLLYMCIEYHI